MFWAHQPLSLHFGLSASSLHSGLISPRLYILGSSALVFTFRALSLCLYVSGSKPALLCLIGLQCPLSFTFLRTTLPVMFLDSRSSAFYLPQDDAACYAYRTSMSSVFAFHRTTLPVTLYRTSMSSIFYFS